MYYDERMDIIDRLCAALAVKTDWDGGAPEAAEARLKDFQSFLENAYPCFHKNAERAVLSPYSAAYRLKGRENGKPALVLAHYDVVPAEAEKWRTPPFEPCVKDGYVYGRGALDMKGILIGIMEACEELCGRGFAPKNDIWFAFGGDEERSGLNGARRTADWFAEKGLRFSWILDEGTPVSEGLIKGVDKPLALFSVEEKGYLSLDLVVEQKPGHASRPPSVQAAAVLGKALVRLSKKRFPWRVSPVAETAFLHIAKTALKNHAGLLPFTRLFRKLIPFVVGKNPETAALFRTTVAMTQLQGSQADNVLPSEVRAVINLRLLPPWTIQKAQDHIEKIINDKRVKVSVNGVATEPVPANAEHAEMRGPGWAEMSAAARAVYPDAVITPFIMAATTDSRYYWRLADGVFRFNPYKLNPAEFSLIHGHNERVSIENLRNGVQFYRNLFERL
jgi:carboxypeptidase PM20D1